MKQKTDYRIVFKIFFAIAITSFILNKLATLIIATLMNRGVLLW